MLPGRRRCIAMKMTFWIPVVVAGSIVVSHWSAEAALAQADGLDVRVAREDLVFDSHRSREAELTATPTIVIAPDGQLIALQPRESLLRVFSAGGEFTDVRGRPGEGPGEFRRMSALGFVGDTLWVSDNALRRVSLFSSTGQHLRTVSWTTLLGSSARSAERAVRLAALLRGGAMLLQSRGGVPNSPAGGVTFFVRPRSGAPDVEIGRINATAALMIIGAEGGTATLRLPDPFAQVDHYAVAQDGSAFALVRVAQEHADSVVVSVSVYDATGTMRFARDFKRPTQELTAADRQEEVERFRVRAQGVRNGQAYVADYRRLLDTRRVYPAISDALLDGAGNLWLQTARGIDERWLVLDRDGRPQMLVRFEKRADRSVVRVDGSTIWAVERDADGVPTIHRYRLELD